MFIPLHAQAGRASQYPPFQPESGEGGAAPGQEHALGSGAARRPRVTGGGVTEGLREETGGGPPVEGGGGTK